MSSKFQKPPIWKSVEDDVYERYINGCNTYDDILSLADSIMTYNKKGARAALNLALYLLHVETGQDFDMGYMYEEFLQILNGDEDVEYMAYWKLWRCGKSKVLYECTKCKEMAPEASDFCPSCGKRMGGII